MSQILEIKVLGNNIRMEEFDSFELETLSTQSPSSKKYFANFAVILDGDAGDDKKSRQFGY